MFDDDKHEETLCLKKSNKFTLQKVPGMPVTLIMVMLNIRAITASDT